MMQRLHQVQHFSGKETELVRLWKSRLIPLASLSALAWLSGCGRAPSFNIMGSFFPAWLICMVAGVVLASIAYALLERFKLGSTILWPVVVYPCLACLFAFILWLVLFS